MTNDQLLIHAAQLGDVDEVRRLIPLSNPKHNNSYALQWAAQNGHSQCVQLLIPVSDPTADNAKALINAARNGCARCVELLIPVSIFADKEHNALQWCAVQNKLECVKLLLDVCDDMKAKNKALLHAVWFEFDDMVDLLYPQADPEAMLKNADPEYLNDARLVNFKARVEKDLMLNNISNDAPSRTNKKM